MRNEDCPNAFDRNGDCAGKQHDWWMQVVATAGSTHATRFATIAAATANSGSGEIVIFF
jgi:hypothetical protein